LIRVGVIGCGYWGPNLLRNFAEAPGCQLAAASDRIAARLDPVKRRYPGIAVSVDPAALIEDPAIDAVAIATPVSTHYELALRALRAGKHVLVEKPLAATTPQARELVEEADRRGLVLLVDHTFIYTGAVRRIRELVQSGELGELYYYDSVRINLGLFQHDVNVVWDLAAHDLAILDYVLPVRPRAIAATGMSHVPGGLEDVAYLTLHFDDSMLGHLHVNWLSPVKIRRTVIGGSRRMVVYDALEPSEKIRIYDRGITVEDASEHAYELQIGYRTGDMWAPQLDLTEALASVAADFLACIDAGTRPQTDGEAGWRVVSMLEAASRSMAEGGRSVEIPTRESR
jgi:predicted dehydrogenase